MAELVGGCDLLPVPHTYRMAEVQLTTRGKKLEAV